MAWNQAWDEGPDIGGNYGPYKQTERFDTYKEALDRLLEDGHAYHCFCSRRDRAKTYYSREAHEIYRYDNTCRTIPLDEARKRIAAGERAVIRLRVPEGTEANFHDLIRGDIEVDSETFDDFVIANLAGHRFTTLQQSLMTT